ncbi:MAG: hypothetical protein AAF600_14470 [Bacteroidota bacterium]
MRFLFGLTTLFFFHFVSGQGMLADKMEETEKMLAASTKQVNQFFRRFNGEEDKKGNRLYQKDRNFQSTSLRKDYLPNLFNQSAGFEESLVKSFVKSVIDKRNPLFLDRHKNDWLAEVNANFKYQGKLVSGLIYLRLEQQGKGYAWIIEDVSFDFLKKHMKKDLDNYSYFIHPMSHELDFMTLRKAFGKEKNANQYTSKDFIPDYLSLFLYEIEKENLVFETVKNVKFHFFVFTNWYFSLANFNRRGYNSGWLIDNLVQFENSKQKEQMKDYIYDKN